jgi:hypothetical protein
MSIPYDFECHKPDLDKVEGTRVYPARMAGVIREGMISDCRFKDSGSPADMPSCITVYNVPLYLHGTVLMSKDVGCRYLGTLIRGCRLNIGALLLNQGRKINYDNQIEGEYLKSLDTCLNHNKS